MSLKERQDKIIQVFAKIENWDDRYKKIIEMGKNLEVMPENLKSEENKVKGCQSQVWLASELTPEKKVHFRADSDALIVKGLVALVLQVYSDATPEEILTTPPEFIEKIGLKNNLSPSRSNGLVAMIKQIQYYATAYKYLLSKG